MPATTFDVLNAIATLTYRQEPTTDRDIAAELATSRQDAVPQLVAALRAGLVDAPPSPEGVRSYVLTPEGERALSQALNSSG